MSPHESSNPDPLELDRYLDGQLSNAERAEFAARARLDPAIRREIELQRRVDFSLKGLSGPIPPVVPIDRVLPSGPRFHFRWNGWIAAAILLVVGVGVAYSLWPVSVPEKIFAREVREGMTPTWVCEDNEHLAEYTKERFGKAVALADLPQDVKILGWKYPRPDDASPTAGILLAKRGETPIVILVDRSDRMITVDSGVFGKLHVMRHDHAGMSFVEISPRNCLSVVKHFKEVPSK